jgi:hypothetical protein
VSVSVGHADESAGNGFHVLEKDVKNFSISMDKEKNPVL